MNHFERHSVVNYPSYPQSGVTYEKSRHHSYFRQVKRSRVKTCSIVPSFVVNGQRSPFNFLYVNLPVEVLPIIFYLCISTNRLWLRIHTPPPFILSLLLYPSSPFTFFSPLPLYLRPFLYSLSCPSYTYKTK